MSRMAMGGRLARTGLLAGLLGASLYLGACKKAGAGLAVGATKDEVARGEYLVTVGGCHDCHTPKLMTAAGPVFDSTRLLSGHPADLPVPPVPSDLISPDGWGAVTNNHLTAWAGPWGVSYTANLTPDETGIGNWTTEQFIATLRTGKHLGVGRPILPPMPWFNYALMSEEDLRAVHAYLRTLKPVKNQVPTPVFASAGAPQP